MKNPFVKITTAILCPFLLAGSLQAQDKEKKKKVDQKEAEEATTKKETRREAAPKKDVRREAAPKKEVRREQPQPAKRQAAKPERKEAKPAPRQAKRREPAPAKREATPAAPRQATERKQQASEKKKPAANDGAAKKRVRNGIEGENPRADRKPGPAARDQRKDNSRAANDAAKPGDRKVVPKDRAAAAKKKKAAPGDGKTARKEKADPKDQEVGPKDKKVAPSDAKARRPVDLPGKRPQVATRYQRKQEADRRDRRAAARDDKKPQARRDKKSTAKRPAPVVAPGRNTKRIQRPFANREDRAERREDRAERNQRNWWNANRRRGDGRDRDVTNITVINHNFRQNVNWNTRRRNWGYNPWWNRPQTRPWYGSSWRAGWRRDYYHDHYPYHRHYVYRPPGYHHHDVGLSIGWGLIGWSLGTMVYDLGYRTYSNPYPVEPIYYDGGQITYHQPITRVAVNTAPQSEEVIVENTTVSESIIAESQEAFKRRDYLVALELADKAIVKTPGDGALHEYRALILFALGKYGEAAGVLNPVLASGPGWDSATMLALYDSQQTYTDQLTRLEDYSVKKDEAADAHFLLGYHYFVTGHLDDAAAQFDRANALMPSDKIAKQLSDLARSSSLDADGELKAAESEVPAEDEPEITPVPVEKLAGTWTSAQADGGKVTIEFKPDGKFTWKHGETTLEGDYSVNDNGLLVLDSEENQMVATVELPQDDAMNFTLAGGPPEDPGMDFKKS
ncbi:MAG: tetratricopeptide repeat protein [Verrucomicrobiota bacterium]